MIMQWKIWPLIPIFLVSGCTKSFEVDKYYRLKSEKDDIAIIQIKSETLKKLSANDRFIMLSLSDCRYSNLSMTFAPEGLPGHEGFDREYTELRFDMSGFYDLRNEEICGQLYTVGYGFVSYESNRFRLE